MLLDSARLAIQLLFAPSSRAVLWKSLGLTLAGLLLIWLALRWLTVNYALPYIDGLSSGEPAWEVWLEWTAAFLAGTGIAFGLVFLIAPVAAAIAGIFLDDLAEDIEASRYRDDLPGQPLPMVQSAVISVQFFFTVLAGNAVALLLLLVPGVNIAAFFLINGYLLGREYFEFAAMRFHSPQAARALRARHGGKVLLAGLMIAGYLAIPLVNLTTPLFAAGLMVHLHKKIARRDIELARPDPEPSAIM